MCFLAFLYKCFCYYFGWFQEEKKEDGKLWYCGHLVWDIVECFDYHEEIINRK